MSPEGALKAGETWFSSRTSSRADHLRMKETSRPAAAVSANTFDEGSSNSGASSAVEPIPDVGLARESRRYVQRERPEIVPDGRHEREAQVVDARALCSGAGGRRSLVVSAPACDGGLEPDM